MPILISYLVMIGIFVGGGVGTLYWLTAPEPTRVAVHHHPRPAVTSSSPAPEGREPSRLPTQSSEKPAEVTNAEVTHAADASRKVDEGVTTPDKPSTTPATTPDVATPGGSLDAPPQQALPQGQAVAAAQATPPARSAKARVASRPRHRHLEAMTLRTVEFPDGRRKSFLISARGRVLAYGRSD